jgi:hypothetical protein
MIESLESRIAPAAVLKFIDVDGDAVTVKTNKGTNDLLEAVCTLTPASPGSTRSHLDSIDFLASSEAASAFAGTDLSITVKQKAGGDGRVEVGGIVAQVAGNLLSMDLGKVSVNGNLGFIHAGDSDSATLALRSLTADSLTEAATPSTIAGSVGKVKIRGDVLAVFSVGDGTIESVYVGGDLKGVEGIMQSGTIAALGIKKVFIGGNIEGAATEGTGRLFAGEIDSLIIRGSVIGNGLSTGFVRVIHAQKIVIGGDIAGGGASGSGTVLFINCDLVEVGGNIIGGASDHTGRLSGTADEKPVIIRIKGDVVAGTGPNSGYVGVAGTIDSLTIKGDIDGKNQNETLEAGLVTADQIDQFKFGGRLIRGGRILTTIPVA